MHVCAPWRIADSQIRTGKVHDTFGIICGQKSRGHQENFKGYQSHLEEASIDQILGNINIKRANNGG